MAELHQENFKPGDRIMSEESGDNIFFVDKQINQWVFAHDNRGRKVQLDCVNGNVWRWGEFLMINNIPQLPEMVITKADNHPIWINGTELVNGMPIITNNHKDETRLNEFIAAGFSPQYIQWLTVNDHRYRVDNHSPCPKRSYHPKSVSYAGIKAETQVWSRGDDPIIAVIQGTSVSLVCAGVSYCVCSAPAGKSKTFQEKFCRAVVRSFLDDPENVWEYVPLYAVPEKAPAEIPAGTYYPHIRCYIQEVPA